MQLGPQGTQLAAVHPLPRGGLAALAAASDSLRLVAWSSAQAWDRPQRPGFGILELNGGWRVRSLEQLQAAVAVTQPACPGSLPPELAAWVWPTSPAEALRQRHHDAFVAVAAGEPLNSRPADSTTGSSGRQPPPPAALVAHRTWPAGYTTQQDEDDEVSSVPKRRRLVAARHGMPDVPAVVRAPARCALRKTHSAPAAALPRFSHDELELLQECLMVPIPAACRPEPFARQDAAAQPQPSGHSSCGSRGRMD